MTLPPHTISFLVDAVGETRALEFVESEAGKRLRIPRSADGSKLARLYGVEVARALCDWRGGEAWEVPLCRVWRARCYEAQGLNTNEIAFRLGLSFRAVIRLLKRTGGRQPPRRLRDPRQASLF
ncbi:hypothetical protein AA0472_2341 [Acetobacter estunensis NRIC 0472]|uniref:Mor transcription activator domain-containing protein n=1 Tax=Acetobacter estunensis TaxID=104097 RepID=A0A967BAQ6_9PROT|nr:hypothetical protein [Acetobacter estunensis]NHO55256.1 hypothetical protein [Acetobacter estunensis]GBQ27178.1 hypothetical protein AA0472_2341 [Acetobacter estunensis NRIC 0472]